MIPRSAVLVVAACALAAGACGEDSPAVDVPDATTTTTTAPAASSSTSAAATALPATADAASKALYNAWKGDDRAAAERVATKKAIDALFDRKWTGPDMSFEGCEPTPAGSDCYWRYEGGSTTCHTAKDGSGYRVSSLESVVD